MTFAEKLRKLRERATPGPYEYEIGDIPIVTGMGLVGRSCVARFCDDPEGHADAQLFELLANHSTAILELVRAAQKANCVDKESMRDLRRCVNKLNGEAKP